MAIQNIFLGTTTGDKTGDGARKAGKKINDNFAYLEGRINNGSKLVSETGFTMAGAVLTINAGWQWIINGITFSNPVAVQITFPLAAAGLKRIDLVVLNTSNTITRVAGAELLNPVAPNVPAGTIAVTFSLVTDSVVGTPAPAVIYTDATKLDKAGYTGNAKNLDDRIVVLESAGPNTGGTPATEISQINGLSDALAAKQPTLEKGVANGYAPLDEFTKIAAQYLTIVNNLTAGGATALLSAEQGKVLKTQIDNINFLLNSDNVNLDSVQEIVDAIENVQTSLATILVNDLTTGGVTKALTAEMGKSLKTLHDALVLVVNGKVPEAPVDTKQYVRKDGAWVEVAANTNTGIAGIKVYNVKDYGALGNGTTDDTVAIQTTINTAYSAGGGTVYFPIGIYIIGGALLNSVGAGLVNYNSQLYIPQTGYTDTTRRTIQFFGEVPPNLFQTLGIGNYIAPNSGVVLRSTIQGSGARPAVICGRGSASNYESFSYTTVFFKNLSIQITPDANSKITMGGINCEFSTLANFENITVFPFNLNLFNSGKPDVLDVVGIAMPKLNCEHINTLRNCSVGGFTQGYLLGEHTSAYDAIAICCVNGFNQKANYHIGNYQKISAFWCQTDFIVTGASFFNVANLQTEWSAQGKWFDATTTISDASNLGRGKFNFSIVEANVGVNNDKYTKIGGLNIEVKPLILPALINNQTGINYTFKHQDAFRLNSFSNAADITVTIPPNSVVSFDLNARILIKRKGVGRVIISAGLGVVFEYPSGFLPEINTQYDAVELVQESINVWGVFGALKTA